MSKITTFVSAPYLFGFGAQDRLAGLLQERAFERVLAVLRKLIRDLSLPVRSSPLGITQFDAGVQMEKTLIQKRRLPTNPRPVDEYLLAAMGGEESSRSSRVPGRSWE